MTSTATDSGRPLHDQQLPPAASRPRLVEWIARSLNLDSAVRYDVAPVRVSAKGRLDKLADQQDTGTSVYADRPDFQTAFKTREVNGRGWLAIAYCDLQPGASRATFAWVGVEGGTIFVAAADSAAEANLKPDQDDVVGVGRNAYVELFIAVIRAGRAKNILLPFISRIWRNDLWAEMLMAAINRHLPGCTVWEGNTQIATYGSAKLLTSVKGREATAYAETFKEQTFEKGVRHLERGGQWDRRESELPLGLARARIQLPDGTTAKSMKVVPTRDRPAVVEALQARAGGASWRQVGDVLARHRVPMPGTRGQGRTFADYSSNSARALGARTAILRHVDYYRTGTWVVTRSVALPNERIRGIDLEHDPATGRRFTQVQVQGLPWEPHLSDEEWVRFDEHEAADERRRTEGAATRNLSHQDLVSAFMGVPAWTENRREFILRPESDTAYRIRSRAPEVRGWRSGEGKLEATLRRSLFHAGLGRAMLAGLKELEDELAPPRPPRPQEDPAFGLEQRISRIEEEIAASQRASERADRELEAADASQEDEEVDHWRERGRQARAAVRRLRSELEQVRLELATESERITESIEHDEADIAEPVLLASLLVDGPNKVTPLVRNLILDYGIADTLHLSRQAGLIRATATARLPLLAGGSFDLPLVWDTPDSKNVPGDGAIVPCIVRLWARGDSIEDLSTQFPGYDTGRITRRLHAAFKTAGISIRGLRIAALKCPILETRQAIAAEVLQDRSLSEDLSAGFATHIVDTYFHSGGGVHVSSWADRADTADVRRVLAVLAEDGADLGINADRLARNAGVRQSFVRWLARRGLLESVGALALRAHTCPNPGCRSALTLYLPAPETGSGLVCPRCWRPQGQDTVLVESYTKAWAATPVGYQIATPPLVEKAARDRDRLLSVGEVAERLAISRNGVRRLDAEGALVPAERTGHNQARLYRMCDLDAVPARELATWHARFGAKDDGLLGASDAAAILGCHPSLVADLVEAGHLAVAARTDGGNRRYARQDVEALRGDAIDAYALNEIGDTARAVGLPVTSLRRLASAGLVPSATTIFGQRRFDIEEVEAALNEIGLLGCPENPIVSIGDLASHPDVPYSTSQLRGMADRGVIPVAGRLGGKRRFRLVDVLDALRNE